MSANALESQGMKIQIGDGATPTEAFTDIPEVKTFNGPNGSASIIDATDLSSTAKEKRMGLQDHGQLQFTVNFLPSNTNHALLMTAKSDRQARNFKLIFTDTPSTTWSFAAFVTSVAISGGVDGIVEGNVTLEITGDITEE